MAFLGPKGPLAVVDVVVHEERGRRRMVVRECRRAECLESVVLGTRSASAACPGAHGRVHPGDPPGTLVQAVGGGEDGGQVFVVSSCALIARERAARRRAIAKTRAALEDLARRVAEHGIEGPDEIGRAAEQILARNDGHRYFGWRWRGRAFLYFERAGVASERAFEGAYVIRAREPERSRGRAAGSRDPDDGTIEGPTTRAFVSALAYLLDRAFEKTRPAMSMEALAAEVLEELARTDVVDDRGRRR